MAILNGMFSNKQDSLIISVIQIAYVMTGRWIDARGKDRTLYDNIKYGINFLANKEKIHIIDNNKDNFVFSNEGLEVDTENGYFIVVELWELQKIFSESNKPFNVFAFFVNLIGTINSKTKEWHMSQDKMVEYWGYSKRTVNDYLKQLSDMQLIYVYNPKKRRNDGTYQNINNSYGRYKDKKYIIQESQKYINTVECEEVIEKVDRRSIKLRYNAFISGAKKYKDNHGLVLELFNECKLYNKSLEKKPIGGTYDGEYKQGELLDLSVFSSDIQVDDDIWGEPDSLSEDYSVERILDMSVVNEVIEKENPDVDFHNKVVTIQKPIKSKEVQIPLDIEIQRYADKLLEDDNNYPKSMFLLDLAEKFPELDDYKKYYRRAKMYRELNI